MNGRQLRALFSDFNDKYFGGRLPQYRIHVRLISSSGFCDWRHRLILIAPDVDHSQRDTLIHEMTHAATRCGHSLKFFAELGRLRTLGLSIPESTQDTQEPTPRLKKDYFVSEAKDVIESDCLATYEDVARKINGEFGYADSVRAFSRRYPWARRAFRVAKSEMKAYQKQLEAAQAMITQRLQAEH